MENFKKGVRRWKKIYFEGDVTMPKVTFWLAATVCLLAGVVYGLLAAPMTHGINIACDNGNNENYYGDREEEDAC